MVIEKEQQQQGFPPQIHIQTATTSLGLCECKIMSNNNQYSGGLFRGIPKEVSQALRPYIVGQHVPVQLLPHTQPDGGGGRRWRWREGLGLKLSVMWWLANK